MREAQDSHERRRAETVQHPQGSGFEGAERFIRLEYRQKVSDTNLREEGVTDTGAEETIQCFL